jgi:hypothetical protein
MSVGKASSDAYSGATTVHSLAFRGVHLSSRLCVLAELLVGVSFWPVVSLSFLF